MMILASCGGIRNKLGLGNFTNLMNHMGLKQTEESDKSFDISRASDDEWLKFN